MNDLSKVVHCKKDKYDIYIARPSIFGNPFSHKEGTLVKYKVSTVEEAIEKYAEWLLTQDEILILLPSLKGLTLGCWCTKKGGLTVLDKPYICHGQILLELANDEVNK